MTLINLYTVQCDRCGHLGPVAPLAKTARKEARRKGFVRIPGRKYGGRDNGGQDMCSVCHGKSSNDGPG